MTKTYLAVENAPNFRRAFSFSLIASCLFFCGILALLLNSPWVFAPLVVVSLGYSIFRWPVAVIAGILFLMPFLPLPLLALKSYGVPGSEVISSVKEVGLIAAGIVLALRRGLQREKLDLLLAVFLAWAIIVTLYHPAGSSWSGLKDDFDFLIAFFVGRVTRLTPRWVRVGMWIAGVVAVLGLIEFFVLGLAPRMLLMNVSDASELTPTFRPDFFSGVRAGSTLGGPLEFGGFCAVMLLIYACLASKLPRKYLGLAIIIALGLVASITRMAGLGLVVGFAYIAVRTGRKLRFLTAGLVCAILILVLIVPVMGLEDYVSGTLSHEDSSLASHRSSIQEMSAYVLTHPLGTGAGTVGPRALVRNPNAKLVESSFLLFGLEYGWLGFLFISICCCWVAWRVFLVESEFALAACAVTIAISTMYVFSPIHMEFGLNSWAWTLIGFGVQIAGAKENKSVDRSWQGLGRAVPYSNA